MTMAERRLVRDQIAHAYESWHCGQCDAPLVDQDDHTRLCEYCGLSYAQDGAPLPDEEAS